MKNLQYQVIMLPTIKTNSNLVLLKEWNKDLSDKLMYKSNSDAFKYDKDIIPQNIYLISDREIKEGDHYYDIVHHNISKSVGNSRITKDHLPEFKKIEATTDKSLLICNGIKREGESCTLNNNCKYPSCQLPQIPESFIKAYVESQGSIKEVQVELDWQGHPDDYSKPYFKKVKTRPDNTVIIHQSKTYSREEVESLLKELHKDTYLYTDLIKIDQWIDERL